MSTQQLAIGVDIGGGHITCAAVDLSDHRILRETVTESKVNNRAASSEILDGWSDAVRRSMELSGTRHLKAICFGMPGPFDYVEGIALFQNVFKYESLYGVHVSREIRARLSIRDSIPIRFINDATAFALGEDLAGRGAEYGRVVAITLGSGFGSAFIEGGIPVVRGDEVPENGALWHLPHADGIINDFLCTTWFLKEYKHRTGRNMTGVKELAGQYDTDEVARQLFHEFGSRLGSFLVPWLKIFRAEVLICGGNISKAYPLFGMKVREALDVENLGLPVAISELGEEAALIGSARLADAAYYERIAHALL